VQYNYYKGGEIERRRVIYRGTIIEDWYGVHWNLKQPTHQKPTFKTQRKLNKKNLKRNRRNFERK